MYIMATIYRITKLFHVFVVTLNIFRLVLSSVFGYLNKIEILDRKIVVIMCFWILYHMIVQTSTPTFFF